MHDEPIKPSQDACEKPRGANRKLEKLRKAINCYYDLYNNGLCNRASQYYQVFGIASSFYKMGYRRPRFSQDFYNLTESKMDQFIVDAAYEQGLSDMLINNAVDNVVDLLAKKRQTEVEA